MSMPGPLVGGPVPIDGLLLLIRSYWALNVGAHTAVDGIGDEIAEDVIDEAAIERAATMDTGGLTGQ